MRKLKFPFKFKYSRDSFVFTATRREDSDIVVDVTWVDSGDIYRIDYYITEVLDLVNSGGMDYY